MHIYLRAIQSFIEFLWKKKFYFMLLFWVITSAVALSETFMAARVIGLIEEYIKNWDIVSWKIFSYNVQWGIVVFVSICLQYIYRYHFVDKNILDFYVNNLQTTAQKALSIPYWKYLQKKSWEVFKKIEKSRESFMNFFFFFYLNLVKDLSWILIAIFFLFYIDVTMALITTSGIPFAIIIGMFFNKKTLNLQNINNKKEDVVFWVIWDAITNFSLLKILNLEKSINTYFHKTEEELLVIQYDISKRWAIANVYIWALIAILRILVLGFWFYFFQNGSINFSELFLFFLLIGWIYYPLGWLFAQIRQVQRWWAWFTEYYEEFVDSYEKEDMDTWKNIKILKWSIEFKNVFFWYTESKKILKNINLKIDAWTKIALVWNTWAGKSTIVNLLLRFWEVSEWSIMLDDTNISKLKKSSLRSHIWVVSQDNSLFNLSIKENLLFSNPKATQKQIKEALFSAQAEFVYELENGIDTVIWERWLKLSGWEKQRISIARLFLKNPEILILDEATSALDNVTEKKIEIALKNLMKGKTSIIIAHRLSTIQHVDSIFLLENWKIVESGNYKELISKKWKFWSLANPEKLILW